jgi:hypothetical protein
MVTVKTLTWGYREQPDLDELAAAVAEVSGGTVRIREYETGSSDYVLVISDRVVDDREVEALLRGEELPDARDPAGPGAARLGTALQGQPDPDP